MTIRVTIKNEDAARPIRVSYVEHDKRRGTSATVHQHDVAPGGSLEVAVHLLRDVLIEERDPVLGAMRTETSR